MEIRVKRKKYLLLPVVALFMFLLLSPLCFGSWVLDDSEGDWRILTDTEWKTRNEDEGDSGSYWAEWKYTGVTLETSYVCALTIDGDTWWNLDEFWIGRWLEHSVSITLENDGSSVGIRFHRKVNRLLGLVNYFGGIKHSIDGGEWVTCTNFENRFYRLYFFKTSDTQLDVVVCLLNSRNSEKLRFGQFADCINGWQIHYPNEFNYHAYNRSFTVPSGFFDDLTITQRVEKNCDGWSVGYKDDESFDTLTGTIETPSNTVDALGILVDHLTRGLYELLPDWLQDFVDSVLGFFAPVFNLMLAVWQTALAVIPLLPYVFVAWLADMGVTSVHQGSFTPIGEGTNRIISTVQGIGSWLVNMASAIWSVIKFW